ncbi:hypothetical protein Tco_0605771 [Tanacetum coccineum]
MLDKPLPILNLVNHWKVRGQTAAYRNFDKPLLKVKQTADLDNCSGYDDLVRTTPSVGKKVSMAPNVVVDNAQLSIKVVVDTVGGANLSNNGAKCKTFGTSNDLGTGECNADVFGNDDQGLNSTNNEGLMVGFHSSLTHFEPGVTKKVNFRSLINEEQVDNFDTVFPKAAMENVKNSWKLDYEEAFTSTMFEDSWGRINIARALVGINVDSVLKYKVSMAIPIEDGTEYTREVIKVEYEWKPPHCTDCKIFKHTNDKCSKGVNNLDTPSDKCTKIVREPVIASTTSTNIDGFMEVKRKKNKGKKADLQTRSRHVDGIRLNKPNPNFYWQKTGADCGVSSSRGIQEEELESGLKTSQWNKDLKFDDEVDEFIFTESDKYGDKLDI